VRFHALVTLHTGKGLSGEDVADDLDDLQDDAEQLSSARSHDSADEDEEEERAGTSMLGWWMQWPCDMDRN
jgi:hypothetical protein